MRVCLVTFDFPPLVSGGLGTESYLLAYHLAREGVHVCVLTVGKQDEEEYHDNLFKIVRLKIHIGNKLTKIPIFQFKVWSWLRKNGTMFDIIHFHETAGFLYFLFGIFSKKNNNAIEQYLHSIKAEFMFHLKFGLLKIPRESLPYMLMPMQIIEEFFCLRRVKKIITISNTSRSDLLSSGMPSAKITVIPRAMAKSYFRIRREMIPLNRPIRFLYVGRLIPRKGVDILIEALNILKKKGIEGSQVDIIGQGPLFKYCTKKIKKNDLTNCKLWGFVSRQKLDELYKEADCFISPSRLEGFGVAILEAAAKCLAIIANDIPIFRELYSDDEVLYFKHDDPYALAEKMKMLIDKPNLISTLRDRIQDLVVRYYTWDEVIKKYITLYSQMLEET